MKKIKKYLIVIVMLLFIGYAYIYGPTYAKYISNSFWDYYLKTKGFYFTSDYLDTTNINNIDNMWNGGSVYFNIKNNLNQSVITSYDINYDVICTVKGQASDYIKCNLNGTNNSTINSSLISIQSCIDNVNKTDVSALNKTDCELEGYNWENQVSTNNLYFDLTLTNESYNIEDVTVNITINSTSPYKKTLIGDFILHKIATDDNKILTQYNNYSYYDRLSITNTYDTYKCLNINWNNNLVIDAGTNEFSSFDALDGYINNVVVNIAPNTSENYIFYSKDNNKIYDINDFTLEEVICE